MRLCNIQTEKKNFLTEHSEVQSRMVQEDQPPLKKETPVQRAETGKKASESGNTKPGFKSHSSVSIKDALQKINQADPQGEDSGVMDNHASEEDNETIPEKEFTKEELIQQWLNYAEKIREEMPRSYSIIKSQLPDIREDHSISLTLVNKSQAEDFSLRIKAGLLDFLRNNLQNKLITIEIDIAEDSASNGKKPYTAEEKFKYMAEKNPVLQKLKQDFNLDFE